MISDLPHLPPPFPPAIMRCATSAAQEYQVPRILLLAIIKTESDGNVRAVNINSNGTKDVGLMQINTLWEKKLKTTYGIQNADHHLRSNYCYNIRVGAWILRQEIGSSVTPSSGYSEYWRRVGNYHSHTPHHNQQYRNKVLNNLRWLIDNTAWR